MTILLITGCHKYIDFLHAAIRRTQKATSMEVIGFVGSASASASASATASYDEATKILHLPVPDTYEALPQKVHAAFEWIAQNRQGHGVFKTDDDMVFDMPKLLNAINTYAHLPYWGVAVGQCESSAINVSRIMARFSNKSLRPTHQGARYAFGAGYWISAETIPFIVAAKATYATSALEDVCTGFVLNSVGIFPSRIRPPFEEAPRCAELLALK